MRVLDNFVSILQKLSETKIFWLCLFGIAAWVVVKTTPHLTIMFVELRKLSLEDDRHKRQFGDKLNKRNRRRRRTRKAASSSRG